MWPDFLILGAMRAGTTSIFDFCRQHPEIFTSPNKEPGYFAFKGGRPDFAGPGDRELSAVTRRAEYQGLFQSATDFKARGEASTIYLYSKEAPARIRQTLPTARLIITLRDPVDRAFSAYQLLRRHSTEPEDDFLLALEREPARTAAGWDPRWYYLQRSLYAKQIARYLDLVPREQILIILFEDLVHAPLGVARRLYEFLGVDSHFEPKTGIRLNRSGTPRNLGIHRFLTQPSRVKDLLLPSVPKRVRRFVADRILHHNLSQEELTSDQRRTVLPLVTADVEQLQVLIDRDLSSWVRP